jgi:hypothetical protein
VEGEPRLGQLKAGGELADAALTIDQGLDHPQPDRIGQGPQQQLGLRLGQGRGGSHGDRRGHGHVLCNT